MRSLVFILSFWGDFECGSFVGSQRMARGQNCQELYNYIKTEKTWFLREGPKNKLFAFFGLYPKLWVGGGPKSIHGILSEKLLIFSKKQNAPNSLKSKTNLTFISHLVESQTWAVGGRGSMFGTKSQKKTFFWHLH